MSLPAALRTLRTHTRLSQRELAARSGVSLRWVRAAETGVPIRHSLPSDRIVGRLVVELGAALLETP